MKIVFITHYTDLYGANRSLLHLLHGLPELGIEPHVLVPGDGEFTRTLSEYKIPFAMMPIPVWISKGPAKPSKTQPYHQYLRKKISQQFGTYQNLTAIKSMMPAVIKQVEKWEIELLYTNSAMTVVGAVASKMMKKPHIWHLREFVDLHYGFEYDLGRPLSKIIINSASAIVAISKAVEDYYRIRPNNRFHVIYNPVATLAEFDSRYDRAQLELVGSQDRPFTFSLVGVIHRNKGQEEAIRAMGILCKRHPQTRLLIVGPGDISKLSQLVEELGISRQVEFWGYISDPYRAYYQSDVVLMCSRHEAMGRVTVEAMSACRPVIGYGSGGTLELIRHGENGLIYDTGPEHLANCMQQLISQPHLAREMGLSAWHYAKKNFNEETYSKSILRVIQESLDKNKL